MPDDTRTQQIEKRIDREIAGGLAISSGAVGAVTIAPKNLSELMEFAKLMAIGGDCVRPAFRNNPGACLALAMQAFRWGADPFAVANKAYITKNSKSGDTQIAYEAQLIDAIVNSSGVLSKRLRLSYEGTGAHRRCKVTGYIRGEDEPFEYESPPVSHIPVKNSPLWQGDPDQQLGYYSKRAWARRHVPEVLLGIYTLDENEGEIIDMTPQTSGANLQVAEHQEPEPRQPWEVFDHAGNVYEFEFSDKAIEACRRMLTIAAAADPGTLGIAWENNKAFIFSLGQDGLEHEAQAIERLYAELAPREPRPNPIEDQPSSSAAPRPTERPDAIDQAQPPPAPATERRGEALQQAETSQPSPPAPASAQNDLLGSGGAPQQQTAPPRPTERFVPVLVYGEDGKPDWGHWTEQMVDQVRGADRTHLRALRAESSRHTLNCPTPYIEKFDAAFDQRAAELAK